tara:strand:+ start:57539 stop:58234 length:696 start_codon:yes stop_codon:yes gene_type:complete
MRQQQQINKIKQTHSDPTQFVNILSEDKINFLIEHYEQSDKKIEKNTGPIMLTVNEGDGIIDDILKLLRQMYGNFNVRSAHFFDVKDPHIIHVDDGKELPDSFKAFTIPLRVIGNDASKAKLIMFDQYYYGGAAKFMKNGPAVKKTFYNTHLYIYDDVQGLNDKGIPEEYKGMLSHLKESWYDGLSIKSYFPWTIGSIICFDSLRLHCASNFKTENIERKLGLSIFTTQPN